MFDLAQLRSQGKQLLLFRHIVSRRKMVSSALAFPFDYRGNSGRAMFPLAINLMVTSRCNLKCEMCHFASLRCDSDEGELTLSEIKNFLQQVARRKAHVFLTGGEPFVRKDIFDIIESIKNAHLTYGICTNGTLLTEEKITALAQSEPVYVIFSLLGDKATHDTITGVPGSFDKIYRNIGLLSSLKHKPKIIINCAVTQSNVRHLHLITKVAESLHVDLLRFEHLNFITERERSAHVSLWKKDFPGDCSMQLSSDFSATCSYSDFIRFLSVAEQRKLQRRCRVPVSFQPFLKDAEIASWYSDMHSSARKCFFIWRSLFIQHTGDVIPCHFIAYKMGNIKTQAFGEIWNSQKYREFRLKLKQGLLPGCARCCKL